MQVWLGVGVCEAGIWIWSEVEVKTHTLSYK